jgi:hypothetical protein
MVESLVVVSVMALIFITIYMIITSASRIYARYSPVIEPESSMLLALKRMQRNMREAILIDMSSTENCVEIGQPVKDARRLNVLTSDGLSIGTRVCYFLGRYDRENAPTTVIPLLTTDEALDDVDIRYTLFAIEQAGDVTNLPLHASYPVSRVREIIDGILRRPRDPGDAGGTSTTSVFSYAPLNAEGNMTDETRLVRIVLTCPVERMTSTGRETIPLTCWTQFCLRNKQPGM